MGGQYRIQLFDQDTLGAIVHARAAFRELDVAEVFHRRRIVDGDVGRSGSRATLTVGDSGGKNGALWLPGAVVGFLLRDRAPILFSPPPLASCPPLSSAPAQARSPPP